MWAVYPKHERFLKIWRFHLWPKKFQAYSDPLNCPAVEAYCQLAQADQSVHQPQLSLCHSDIFTIEKKSCHLLITNFTIIYSTFQSSCITCQHLAEVSSG